MSNLVPAELSDDALELFSSSTSVSEQSRILADALSALSTGIAVRQTLYDLDLIILICNHILLWIILIRTLKPCISNRQEEKNYLSRATRFPFLSTTVLTYMLHPSFHNGFIDKSMDSIKRTFSILSLLKAPVELSEEYSKYINSSKNAEVELLLDQPSEKRAAVTK